MSTVSVDVIVAKALFHLDMKSGDADAADAADDKKNKWAENKANYIRTARQLSRLLEKQGVSLEAKSLSDAA